MRRDGGRATGRGSSVANLTERALLYERKDMNLRGLGIFALSRTLCSLFESRAHSFTCLYHACYVPHFNQSKGLDEG